MLLELEGRVPEEQSTRLEQCGSLAHRQKRIVEMPSTASQGVLNRYDRRWSRQERTVPRLGTKTGVHETKEVRQVMNGFSRSIGDNSPELAAACMLRISKLSGRWLGERGFTIGFAILRWRIFQY